MSKIDLFLFCICFFLSAFLKVSQDDVITIDSDDDNDNEVGSVGSEIILISDSEPEDHLVPDYEDEGEEIDLEESERNQDVKGTFPLVKKIF